MRPLFIFTFIALLTIFSFINFANAQIAIKNPLKYDTIEQLINAIINFLFTLALVVVPLVIVVAGYFFITSEGDPVKVAKARQMVIYALVGLLIIAASKGIIAVIEKVIKG
jgi:hypothetical protein